MYNSVSHEYLFPTTQTLQSALIFDYYRIESGFADAVADTLSGKGVNETGLPSGHTAVLLACPRAAL